MAVDLALLRAAAREAAPPTLRFYAWEPPAVSLGRFQSPEGIDLEYARRRGWDVVRRPTGGRAVLHHLELTYSLVLPPSAVGGAGVRTSYCVLARALNAALYGVRRPAAAFTPPDATPGTQEEPHLAGPFALLGTAAPPSANHRGRRGRRRLRFPYTHTPTHPHTHTPTHLNPANCFAHAAGCDTVVPGGKLAGSAQVRRDGALLQHGSILLDAEEEAWTALFGSPGRLVTLRHLLGAAPAPEEVAAAVLNGFLALGVEARPGTLSPEEEEAARGEAASMWVG
jgi:lipoyl(octanoyl) transferase